ncbi:MAG: T9SS type A sorting domain-containing protein, partial [candidate division WOR-3 bacterium]
KGRIKFKIPENITSGYKNLTVSAYDNFYNLGIITKIIYIEEEEKISIRCLPFPNPSKNKVYFGIETNENGKIDLKIYTLRGRLIYEKSGIYINKGFNKIEWNGKDRDGNFVSNGIYIYKIEFENKEKNYKKTIKGKIAIVK